MQSAQQEITDTDKRSFYERCFDDRRWFIERFLKIKTRDQRVIQLKVNEAQNRFLLQVEAQERAGKPIRGIGLKPRRVGLSTIIQATFFQKAATHSNVNALTCCHDLDSAQELFEMNGIFYDELPAHVRPMKRFSNRKELVFENPDEASRSKRPGLRSKLRTATAGDEELGRSKEIHLLHCSEVAFWDKAEGSMLSVCNSVAPLPSTMIFKESTPSGVGNYFHREYQAAKRGDSDYFAYFMAWFEFYSYQRPLEVSAEEFADSLDDDERQIQKAYSLSLEQLNWRRWCIRENCGRSVDKFNQEFPSDDVSCFLLSGRGVFDGKMLQRMLLQVSEPPFRGYLKDTPDNPLHTRLEENTNGYVRMWRPPKFGRRYVIGADVAEGLINGDFSCAHVYDWETMELCAEFHGHIDPDLYADELARLGNLYNRALIGVEDNGHGASVNRALRRLAYPNLFYRKEIDDRTNQRSEKLGWLTTSVTKPVMVDSFAQACRDGAIVPSKETVEEMTTFVVNDAGKMGAQSGTFDDRVIASSIASEIRKYSGIERLLPALR
jgi:hypothetical protein